MKIFTLAIDERNSINFTGDLAPQEAKQIIEAVMYQQAFEQGRQAEKQRIRQGYKAKRRKRNERTV